MPIVQTNGIDMYYEEAGDGPPLLMIMGITAPGSVWEAHADAWKAHFRCIMPDNRGVGRSSKPGGSYTSARMADDMAGLLDALDIERVRVAGVSMGSIIAQQLAIRCPDRVRSLVLMCPWARCDRYAASIFRHMMTIKARLRPEEFMEYIQLLIFSKGTWDDIEGYAELINGRTFASVGEEPQPLHGLEGQGYACIEHNVLEALPQIAAPTLVIGGEQDIFVPPWMVEEVAAGIPNAELHMYPGAGHAFHWERIEDFNPRVADWLLAH